MKKSLIALAVAGAFAAPAFAATSNVDISGKIAFDVTNVSSSGAANDTMIMNDNNSSITLKGSEDLGGGLKAGFSLTYGLNVASGATMTGQNQILTLGGGFGTVVMGTHDNLVKGIGRKVDLFADQSTGDARHLTAIGLVDARANNVLAYVSPSFAGVTIAAGRAMDESKADGAADIDMLTANYENGPIYAALGYYAADYANAEKGWRLGGGYTMGDLKLVATYQKISDVGGAADSDVKTWGLGAAYAMGPMTFKGQYYSLDKNGASDNDAKMFAVGMDYALSKRTTAQVAYSKVKNDGGAAYGGAKVVGGSDLIGVVAGKDPSRLSVGIKHTF